MSYCVNCGVELNNSASECPLCDTPVINPNSIRDFSDDPPYPERIELPPPAKRRYGAIIASLLLLLPNIVCVLTNILLTPELLWCVYVVASSALFWFISLFPFMMKKVRPYLIITVDAIVAAAYIFVFYYYDSNRTGWFGKIAIPLVVGFFAMVALLVWYFSKKRTQIKSAIAILTFILALSLYVCLVLNLNFYSVITLYITLILAVSCLILIIFFIAADRNPKMRAWLQRKFFF